jgi:hypothetical protein
VRQLLHLLFEEVHEATRHGVLIRRSMMARRKNLFSTRRRGSSGEGALIGLLVMGAIAIAAFGVYLVAITAVALVVWVARLVVQQTQARASTPKLIPATGEASAPPPESQFHVAHAVDAAVFEHPPRAQAAAVKVFESWAAKIPRAPKNARDAVRSLGLRTRLVGRLVTNIEGRRAVVRTAPYGGRDRVGAPPLDRAAIDSWNPPRDLRKASRHVASCWGCKGDGRVSCVPCGGAGRVTCQACDGEGKYHGTTASGARRVLNCKTCRGKCDVVCTDCTRGRVECPTCHKTKKLECWFEIDSSQREDVQIEPDGNITRAYRWGRDGVSASREEVEQDAKVICDVARPRALHPGELPDAIPPEWLAAHGAAIQPRFEPGEQVRSQTFTLLEVPSIDVTYGVGAEVQTIELHGLRMLAPPLTTDRLFHRRARSLHRLIAVLAAVPTVAGIYYLSRGSYFHRLPTLGVVLAALAAGICIYGAVWNATLGRRAARHWLKVIVAPVAAAAALAILAEPSARAARKYFEADQLASARAELEALGTRSSHPNLWADLKLRETVAEPDIELAIERAGMIPEDLPQAIEARRHVDHLLLAAATAAVAANQVPVARNRLAGLSETAARSNEARVILGEIALADGNDCVRQRNWSCALESSRQAASLGLDDRSRTLRGVTVEAVRTEAVEALRTAEATEDLAARVPAQKAAFAAWSALAAIEPAPEPATLASIRIAHERDVVQLAKLEEVVRKKQEAANRRAEAAQAKEDKKRAAIEAREQRRRAAAERREARASRGLMCNDGTESPGCSCGGSWRGCCSRHGGVAGCAN